MRTHKDAERHVDKFRGYIEAISNQIAVKMPLVAEQPVRHASPVSTASVSPIELINSSALENPSSPTELMPNELIISLGDLIGGDGVVDEDKTKALVIAINENGKLQILTLEGTEAFRISDEATQIVAEILRYICYPIKFQCPGNPYLEEQLKNITLRNSYYDYYKVGLRQIDTMWEQVALGMLRRHDEHKNANPELSFSVSNAACFAKLEALINLLIQRKNLHKLIGPHLQFLSITIYPGEFNLTVERPPFERCLDLLTDYLPEHTINCIDTSSINILKVNLEKFLEVATVPQRAVPDAEQQKAVTMRPYKDSENYSIDNDYICTSSLQEGDTSVEDNSKLLPIPLVTKPEYTFTDIAGIINSVNMDVERAEAVKRRLIYVNLVGDKCPLATKFTGRNQRNYSIPVSQLADKEIKVLLNQYRNIFSNSSTQENDIELPILELIALLRYAMWRTHKYFLVNKQILAALNIVFSLNNTVSALPDSLNNYLFNAFIAAIKWHMGLKVTVCGKYPVESLEKVKSFFKFINAPYGNELIPLRGDDVDLQNKRRTITYSQLERFIPFTLQELAFRNASKYDRSNRDDNNDIVTVVNDQDVVIFDDADLSLLDDAATQISFVPHMGRTNKFQLDADLAVIFLDFVAIPDFIKTKCNRHFDLEVFLDLNANNQRFINFLQQHAANFSLLNQLDKWIDAAYYAMQLCEGTDFAIEMDSKNQPYIHYLRHRLTYNKVKVGLDGDIDFFLAIRINREISSGMRLGPYLQENVPDIAMAHMSISSFMSEYGRRGNVMIGVTSAELTREEVKVDLATCGFHGYSYYPRVKLDALLPIEVAKPKQLTVDPTQKETDNEAQLRRILEIVEKAVEQDQPVVIICKDHDEADDVKQHLVDNFIADETIHRLDRSHIQQGKFVKLLSAKHILVAPGEVYDDLYRQREQHVAEQSKTFLQGICLVETYIAHKRHAENRNRVISCFGKVMPVLLLTDTQIADDCSKYDLDTPVTPFEQTEFVGLVRAKLDTKTIERRKEQILFNQIQAHYFFRVMAICGYIIDQLQRDYPDDEWEAEWKKQREKILECWDLFYESLAFAWRKEKIKYKLGYQTDMELFATMQRQALMDWSIFMYNFHQVQPSFPSIVHLIDNVLTPDINADEQFSSITSQVNPMAVYVDFSASEDAHMKAQALSVELEDIFSTIIPEDSDSANEMLKAQRLAENKAKQAAVKKVIATVSSEKEFAKATLYNQLAMFMRGVLECIYANTLEQPQLRELRQRLLFAVDNYGGEQEREIIHTAYIEHTRRHNDDGYHTVYMITEMRQRNNAALAHSRKFALNHQDVFNSDPANIREDFYQHAKSVLNGYSGNALYGISSDREKYVSELRQKLETVYTNNGDIFAMLELVGDADMDAALNDYREIDRQMASTGTLFPARHIFSSRYRDCLHKLQGYGLSLLNTAGSEHDVARVKETEFRYIKSSIVVTLKAAGRLGVDDDIFVTQIRDRADILINAITGITTFSELLASEAFTTLQRLQKDLSTGKAGPTVRNYSNSLTAIMEHIDTIELLRKPPVIVAPVGTTNTNSPSSLRA